MNIFLLFLNIQNNLLDIEYNIFDGFKSNITELKFTYQLGYEDSKFVKSFGSVYSISINSPIVPFAIFANFDQLENVTFWKNVKEIEERAFEKCDNFHKNRLKNVIFGV